MKKAYSGEPIYPVENSIFGSWKEQDALSCQGGCYLISLNVVYIGYGVVPSNSLLEISLK